MKISGNFLIISALILIFLKLIGEVSWSWWIILCPLWIPLVFPFALLAVAVVTIGIVGVIALFLFIIEEIFDR